MLTVSIKKQLHRAFLDVDFEVNNEIVVLFGPSGAGKTTILNIIAGLSDLDEGTIILNQKVFNQKGTKPLPVQERRIGYLFQDFALFPHMTVRKNIMYGLNRSKNANELSFVEKLLEVLNIGHLLHKYPNHISGGEKQRVALARALATQPKLLLLDEPFSSLDIQTKKQCHEELLRLTKLWDIPVILVTHDLDEARKLGNRILYLSDGKIKTKYFSVSN